MERFETYEIEDLATLELICDAFRMRILTRLAGEPTSVRELAGALDVPVTRLYYHVNLLEQRGLVAVAETRKVGAMVERRYQAVADSFRAGDRLVSAMADNRHVAEAIVASIVEGFRTDAIDAIERRFAAGGGAGGDDELGMMSRSFVLLTPDRYRYWQRRLADLMSEMVDDSDGTPASDLQLYTMTMMLAPAAGATNRPSVASPATDANP